MVRLSSEGETDMTIYRGFIIIPADGGFTIRGVVTEVFSSEEMAMDHIDAMRKAARLAQG